MLPVYAEASADHRVLYVMAGGGPALAAERARASKHMQALTPLFRPDPEGIALTSALTWPTVLQLQETFDTFFSGWTMGPNLRAWLADQLARRTQDFGAALLRYRPPAPLTPYFWQSAGAAMIAATGRALITDEPRTGKTITTILGLVELGQRGGIPGPVVVVCPASVVDPWVEAWRAWAPHVRVVAWRGPKRRELVGTADVYVTSYEGARTDAPDSDAPKAKRVLTDALQPGGLVVDECHLVKNPKAARTQAVNRIAVRVTRQDGAIVALSGTPITRDPGDLFPVLKIMEPHAYPASERWIARYCNVLQGDYSDEILGLLPSRKPEFNMALLGQTRRVARADVMSHLPPKTYTVRTVELPPAWRKAYDDFESTMLAELPDSGEELSVFDARSVLGHLSGLASAPADVEITHGPDTDQWGMPKRHVHLELRHAEKRPSWKIAELLEVMSERPGERVVVYAPRAQLVRLAGQALEAKGYRVGYIIGGQAQGERTAARLAFQGGELDVVCCTTGAGGVGITLSAAETLVFLQRPWALVESIQAEDRAEGDPNQTRGTEIIDIVAANTVESRVRARLRQNAGKLADLLDDPRIVRELLGGADVERLKAAS